MTLERATALAGALFVGMVLSPVPAAAQTFTMSRECRQGVEAAQAMNDAADYQGAIGAFEALAGDCRTRDAKEAIHTGRAHAYNQLGRHQDAIGAADEALDAYDKNLAAYFERAAAKEAMGDAAGAEADYNRVIELTENNENTAERATLYAKIADMYAKAGKPGEADTYLAKAIELDPGNPFYQVLRGDWAVRSGDYTTAFAAYDEAEAMGKTDTEMYQIRTEAAVKMVQDKYGTTNAQELRREMSAEDTGLVCREIRKATDHGYQNMQVDMFAAMVCQ